MDWLHWALDIFLHLDKHLGEVLADYGLWTYAVLFAIVFVETGLVIWPFLPGDSLLFAAGALATTTGSLSVAWLIPVLWAAAVLGDQVNYHAGKFVGPHLFTEKHRRFLKKEHLDRTHRFFETYGGKTIILARFVPIVRTFAPFVAGMGAMSYARFSIYNVAGGLLWVGSMVLAGHLFGGIEVVKNNFGLVVIGIVFVSILPGLFEWWRHRRKSSGPGARGSRLENDEAAR
jgi:membrane-associated protein